MSWYMRWIINAITWISTPIRWWDDRRRTQGPASVAHRSGDPRQITRVEHRAMKRGVGYCKNTDCEDFSKGVFLLNHGDTFYCPRCRLQGFVEKERGSTLNNHEIFSEVRVEYNFCAIAGNYRETAIVRDDSLPKRGTNVYTLTSALIKTERRALKVAEAVLSNLNRYRGLLNGDELPRTTEIILSFDDDADVFMQKLHRLAKEWESSGLSQGA